MAIKFHPNHGLWESTIKSKLHTLINSDIIADHDHGLKKINDQYDLSSSKIGHAHTTYCIEWDSLHDSRCGDIKFSKFTGSRVLVYGDEDRHDSFDAFSAVEYHSARNNSNGKVTHTNQSKLINFGPFARATSKSISELQFHPIVLSSDMEFRIIRCSPLKIFAVWLHNENLIDMIYPVFSMHSELQDKQLIDASEFRSAVKNIYTRTIAALNTT